MGAERQVDRQVGKADAYENHIAVLYLAGCRHRHDFGAPRRFHRVFRIRSSIKSVIDRWTGKRFGPEFFLRGLPPSFSMYSVRSETP